MINRINSILLILGFFWQAYWVFDIALAEARFDIIFAGMLAWISIPFLILFFANRHIKRTKAGRITILIAVIIVAVIGSLLISDAFLRPLGPLEALILVFMPLYGIFMSLILTAIGAVLNLERKKRQ